MFLYPLRIVDPINHYCIYDLLTAADDKCQVPPMIQKFSPSWLSSFYHKITKPYFGVTAYVATQDKQ